MENKNVHYVINQMRDYYHLQHTKDISFRIKALKKLYANILTYENDILNALYVDLHKSDFESYSTEIGLILKEIKYHIKHLKSWQRTKKKSTPFLFFPSKSKIIQEPYGVVLIISPWNYPFQLMINPLIGAISAGNCVVLKTSPSAPATANVLDKLILSTFDKSYVSIFHGDKEMNQLLLQERFDYIFFTGSPKVGKVVMEAASHFLTPITLELGGKSPCIVDSVVDIDIAARRIIWGKTINSGQTCIAPDYLWVHKNMKESLIQSLKRAVDEMYGMNPQDSPDYPRIITDQAMERLISYLQEGTILMGGDYDINNRYIQPTVIEVNNDSSILLNEEIFGPIFPLLVFDDISEIINKLASKEKPLALYFFSKNKENINRVLRQTSSGGVCVNDTIIHVANHKLPFGGVGNSGMGAYHGKYSFKTFSHSKAVVESTFALDIKLKYPPYKNKFKRFKKFLS